MTRNTEQLIRQLAENVKPLRPLARPHIRTAAWLALSISYIGVVLLVMVARYDLSSKLFEFPFIVEQLAGLATGIAAAVAAFATVVPGRDRRWTLLPLAPLAVWLGSLGPGCVYELRQFGFRGLPLQHNLWCFPFIVLLGTIPAVVMALMLRRGAPLTPHLTAALGGLAAAGLGNVGVRLIHPEDVSMMLIVWHIGGVMALSALACGTGHYLLNWPAKYRSIR